MLQWLKKVFLGSHEEPAYHFTISRQTSTDGEGVQISFNGKSSENQEMLTARLKMAGDIVNSRVVWHNQIALMVEAKIKEEGQAKQAFKKLEGNA